jgi:hypothetical protein
MRLNPNIRQSSYFIDVEIATIVVTSPEEDFVLELFSSIHIITFIVFQLNFSMDFRINIFYVWLMHATCLPILDSFIDHFSR